MIGEKVLRLHEAGALHEGGVVARIPRRHDHRVFTEAVHQQTALVIRRRVHGTAHGVEAAAAQPCFGGGKQGAGDFLVIAALEETKEAHAVGMELVVRSILDRGDSTDGPAVAERQEESTVGLLVERVGLRVERVAHSDAKRRHPLRMLGTVVDLPGEIDEATQIARGLD